MINYPGYYTPGYVQPYSMPAYFPPPGGYPAGPGQPMPPPPHMQGQQFYPDGHSPPDLRFNNGNGPDSINHSRTSSRNSNGHSSANGNGRRGPVPQRRSPWSYGPGPAMGGMMSAPSQIPDAIGPRLGSRRTSNGSQSTGNRTPGDEASSVTVSDTFLYAGSFLPHTLSSANVLLTT